MKAASPSRLESTKSTALAEEMSLSVPLVSAKAEIFIRCAGLPGRKTFLPRHFIERPILTSKTSD